MSAVGAMNGDAPTGGLALDDDEQVRFYQYKALARAGTPEALAQLRAAAPREEDSLLAELVKDSLASVGIGLSRRTNAASVTSGATTSP